MSTQKNVKIHWLNQAANGQISSIGAQNKYEGRGDPFPDQKPCEFAPFDGLVKENQR